MADFLYNTGSMELWDGTTDFLTEASLKIAMATSSYSADRDDDLAEVGVDDFNEHEITGTGYVAGWSGSGRKVLNTPTITIDKANDRAYADSVDLTWTALNADVGTPSQAVMLEERATDDTNTRLVVHWDSGFPVTPNGGDVTLQWAAPASGGMFYLATA